jgi:thymidine phosphorylase
MMSKSDPIAVVHAADEASAEAAAVLLQKAFQIGQTEGEQAPVVSQRLTAKDL